MKIDKRFEIPFICSAGAVPWSKVWKNQRRATEVKLCSIPCLSLSTPAEEIKELSLCEVRSLWTSRFYVVGWHLLQILVEPTSAILEICDQFVAWLPLELPTFRCIYIYWHEHDISTTWYVTLFYCHIAPLRIASDRPNFFRYYRMVVSFWCRCCVF